MRTKYFLLLPTAILIITSTANSQQLTPKVDASSFDYTNYAIALKTYVDDAGMVNYKKLKSDRAGLDSFVTSAAKFKRSSYDKWNDDEKIAFWLNTYNGFTLRAIIDNYPIKSSFFRSRVWPKNSIRQIPGVWKKLKFDVMGRPVTLEHIEHKILRKEFNEPRIHMALVCAAMGCPPLRNEPYYGGKLDEQLGDQSRKFLSDPLKFRVGKNTLELSPIFKWFGEDFVKTYGLKEGFSGYEGTNAAVLNFIAKYLEDDQKQWLGSGKQLEIKYQEYDWSLNEQKATQNKSKAR